MYWFPTSKAQLKIWVANFKANISAIGTRINEPAADIAKAQANMDRILTDIKNAEVAKQEWQRLTAIMDATLKEVTEETRQFVKRLKGNPLLKETDAEMLQINSTTIIADLTDYQPVLTVKESGGNVHIGFKKRGADSMNIYMRLQGETSFKLVASAQHSPYIYNVPPIAAGSSQTFEFYGIANLANTEVGLRSEIVTVKISG